MWPRASLRRRRAAVPRGSMRRPCSVASPGGVRTRGLVAAPRIAARASLPQRRPQRRGEAPRAPVATADAAQQLGPVSAAALGEHSPDRLDLAVVLGLGLGRVPAARAGGAEHAGREEDSADTGPEAPHPVALPRAPGLHPRGALGRAPVEDGGLVDSRLRVQARRPGLMARGVRALLGGEREMAVRGRFLFLVRRRGLLVAGPGGGGSSLPSCAGGPWWGGRGAGGPRPRGVRAGPRRVSAPPPPRPATAGPVCSPPMPCSAASASARSV